MAPSRSPDIWRWYASWSSATARRNRSSSATLAHPVRDEPAHDAHREPRDLCPRREPDPERARLVERPRDDRRLLPERREGDLDDALGRRARVRLLARARL